MRISIIDRSPIFVQGMAEILRGRGHEVSVEQSWSDEQVDAVVVGPDACGTANPVEFIAHLTKMARVIVVVPPTLDMASSYLGAGAQAVISRCAPVQTVLETVQGVTSVTAPAVEAKLLSPRERQVLRLIAKGYTHEQVARSLTISRHTVDTYVRRVRIKLGLGNKAELATAAMWHG
jgi:DNA-binding NarL/FixJ family response regulator